MRVLLDECVDHRLAREIPGHKVRHVRAMGWASLDDARLFRRAAAESDAFVTVDRGFAFQQNLSGMAIKIVILRARRNTRAVLRPLVPALLQALATAAPGTVTWLGKP